MKRNLLPVYIENHNHYDTLSAETDEFHAAGAKAWVRRVHEASGFPLVGNGWYRLFRNPARKYEGASGDIHENKGEAKKAGREVPRIPGLSDPDGRCGCAVPKRRTCDMTFCQHRRDAPKPENSLKTKDRECRIFPLEPENFMKTNVLIDYMENHNHDDNMSAESPPTAARAGFLPATPAAYCRLYSSSSGTPILASL